MRHAEAHAPRAGVPRLTAFVVHQRLLVTAARPGARIDGVSGPGPAGVALEGPGTFVSKPLPGASCVRKVPRHGASMDDHQRLGAARLHPGDAVAWTDTRQIRLHAHTDAEVLLFDMTN